MTTLCVLAGVKEVINAMNNLLKTVGNLHTLQLEPQVGRWHVTVESPNPYTLRAIGECSVNGNRRKPRFVG